MRSNVINNSPWPERVLELNLFIVFIASKPATMIARTDNPLFPAQGPLKDRRNGGAGISRSGKRRTLPSRLSFGMFDKLSVCAPPSWVFLIPVFCRELPC